MRKKYKILIILGITGACFIAGFLVFNKSSLSDSAVGFVEKNEKETKEIKESEDKPVCLSGSIEPKKVASGDEVIVTVEIKDNYGIEKVIADMGGIETIELNRIMKQSSNETIEQWQGRWLAHSTEPKNYQTMVYATNVLGKQSSMSINWEDPSITDAFTDESKIATSTNITVTGGQAKLAEAVWPCGDSVTFTYKGSSVTYGTVNGAGSECWMDRNLGASRVATAYNDYLAYGDLFQWGREDDGHQGRTCTSSTSCTSDYGAVEGDMTLTQQPGNNLSIKEQDWPYDWATTTWTTRWTVAEDDPCPDGWRVPTNTELSTEEVSWAQQNYNGAFASPLKLTAGGIWYRGTGSLTYVGSYGYYWSSVVDGSGTWSLTFYSGNSYMSTSGRANGFSVRCVKD